MKKKTTKKKKKQKKNKLKKKQKKKKKKKKKKEFESRETPRKGCNYASCSLFSFDFGYKISRK